MVSILHPSSLGQIPMNLLRVIILHFKEIPPPACLEGKSNLIQVFWDLMAALCQSLHDLSLCAVICSWRHMATMRRDGQMPRNNPTESSLKGIWRHSPQCSVILSRFPLPGDSWFLKGIKEGSQQRRQKPRSRDTLLGLATSVHDTESRKRPGA